MKKYILPLFFSLLSFAAFSQKGISYQAIILDPNPIEAPGVDIAGQPLVNGDVWMKFSIYNGSALQFEEIHKTKTDAYGLVSLLIGSESPTAFNNIVWDANQKNMQVFASFNQGGSYTKVSEQKLVYTPYALFSETAGKLGGTLAITGGGTGATTLAEARVNLGVDKVDNTPDAKKPISAATQAALDLKANSAEVSAGLALKANTTDVNTALALKANTADINSALELKANTTDVTAGLDLKADKTDMAAALALKANAVDITTALAAKADTGAIKAYVDTRLASGNFTSTQSSTTVTITDADASTKGKIQLAGDLGGTANAPTVPGLALKANAADVTTALALKADTTYVLAKVATATLADADASTKGKIQLAGDLGGTAAAPTVPGLALKANSTDVSTALAIKADTTYVLAKVAAATIADADASTKGKIQLAGDLGGTAAAPTVPGLALKANEADVITALALKANTTDVTTALALKANTADLTTLTTTVNTNTASITVNTASITANSASIDLKASQSDLTNLTTRVDGNSLSITNLATVARSGSYTDLLNLPTSITASTLSGTVSISKGGTGAVTANAAFNALAPDQASKSGKFLTTDGTSTSWASVASNLPTTVNTSSSYNIVMATDQNSSLVTGTGNGGTTATLNPYTGQMNISGATVGGYGLATSGKLTVGSIAPAVTSAQLEVNSTNKGFLPPRMTLAQRSQIYAPVQGLMIMCTDCSTQGEVQVYTGSYWSNVAGTLPTTTIGTITAPLVGAAYQGGKVAYILTPADPGYDHKKVKGFIIALQDLPSDYPLRSGSVYISTIANSGTAVGDGLVNTNLLVAAYGNTNIHAAKAANDYSITEAGVVYDDWYLPSKDEMKIIYDNRVVLNAGFNANTDKWYWTSSYASNSSGGWRLTFVNGYIGAQGSESSYFVRPIRYFSIDKNIDISASTFTGSLVGNASTATLANTATTAVNITATANNSLTSLPNLETIGTITSGVWSASMVDIAHGGTGSNIQNFIDLSSNQNSIGGSKAFINNIAANGINIGKGIGGSSTLIGDATSANDNSTAVGFMALNGNSGTNNTALGTNAMRNSSSTAYTTAVGVVAGQNSNTGNNNTFLGYAATVPDGSAISNSTAIGSGATVTSSNTIQLGADGTNGFTPIENVKTTGTITAGTVTYPKSHGNANQVLSTTGSGTLTWTTISNTANANNLNGTIAVTNGGTGATTLIGYLKGNGTNAFTASTSIPATDITGLIKKVNGSLPDADGFVTIPFGSVTTGTLDNRPIIAGTNGNIYVVSGDATASDNGRTYISDGTNWNEVTTNQAATDARYLQLAGGSLNGNLTIPANKILTITDAPINSTDAANKRYVDDAISTSAISGTTSSTLGKIQLSGDLAGVGSTAINPKVGSVGGSTAALINSAEVLANAAVSTNTANQIVKRDVIGNFSAGTISANLTGNVTGDVTGNISGTSRNVTGIVNVVNGGTGTSTLTGYLKGNGMTAFSASSTIPASDITGLIKKVNGSIPDADGNVAISFGTVSTGSLTNRPVSAGTNGNIYVVSGDATTAENGRTFISDGTSWKEVTSNQSATDARYLKLAGGTMAGNIVIPTTNKITITDAPVSSSDAVNKAYVDASSASASVADATTTSLGKIQLSGDLAGSGTSATNPKVSSVGGSTAALINAAEIATNAATYSNTANQIVKRDGSGNFSAGNITANIIGNVSGNAGNISGIVAGANGGTGVVNSGKTITIGGNFETIHALKFTTTAPTTLTLPSSGTLATVQQLDAKELLSNKSSDVNLGTSNDKFPTQNAVKSYVDSKDANLISNSIITGSLKVTGGTPATGKVLTSDGLGNAVWAAPAAPSATQHTIGEVFGGGIVVYVTPNGLHGLIAETIDQSAGSNWFNAVNRMSIPDLHSTEGKNYTDWRLPTKNEMNLVFLQRNITGLAGTFVVPGEYWTSESSNDNAYYFYFSTDQYAGGGGGTFEGSGPQASKTTTVGKYCRAVRSF